MEVNTLFTTPIYFESNFNFFQTSKLITEKYLEKARKDNPNTKNSAYPLYQTDSFLEEESLQDLFKYILKTSHNILIDQGYDMTDFRLFFTEFWAQEHFKSSGHEYHTHPGNLFSAFYFLEVPKDSSRIVFYDPRPAREFSELLPQKNENELTLASRMVNYVPEEGQLIIAPAWLPHSFTRNESDKPFKFIHANISHYYNHEHNNQAIVI